MSNLQVTAWKNHGELLEVRSQIYGEPDAAQEGLYTIAIWRIRHPIPIVIDTTALLKEAQLQDLPGASHIHLQLAYSTAIIRFVTGLLDATQDGLYKKSMFESAAALGLPKNLVIMRHECIHEHLPRLSTLREGAKQALDWVWNYYWKDLDKDILDGETFLERLKPAVEAQLKVWWDETGKAQSNVESKSQKAPKKRKNVQNARISDGSFQETMTNGTVKILSNLCLNQPNTLRVVAEALLEPEEYLAAPFDQPDNHFTSLVRSLSQSQALFLDIFLRHIFHLVDAQSQISKNRKETLINFMHYCVLEDESFLASRPNKSTLYHYILGRCVMRPSKLTLSLGKSILENDGARSKQLKHLWMDVMTPLLASYDLGQFSSAETSGANHGEETEQSMASGEEEDSEDDQDSDEDIRRKLAVVGPGEILKHLIPGHLTKKAFDTAVKAVWE